MRATDFHDQSDESLHAACLRGEHAAWDALVARYSALIYSIPLKSGLAEADAADVFQAVCVTLLEKLSTIRDPRRLAAWLITTTTRETWAVQRTRSREQPLLSNVPIAADGLTLQAQPADPSPPPPEFLERLERQQQVRCAVARLPSRCRTLLEALFSDLHEQATYEETARRIGIPLNSLGPTRARCLARLKKILQDEGYEA